MSPRRAAAGGRIDRSRTVRFTFDGHAYNGHPGDTLASALLANGVRLFGRSFKYHRPRGLVSAGIDEPNALVTVLRGAVREPNVPATTVEIFDGLVAVSQNRFPSLAFDVNAVNQLGGKLLGAGFYYKTFMGPAIGPLKGTRFWMFCEHFIRRAAGLGRVGDAGDTARYERVNAFCDVLVVGSGPAGLMAARAAAESGARIILAEFDRTFGGSTKWSGETIGGRPANLWAELSSTNCTPCPTSRCCRALRSGATTTTTRLPRWNVFPITRRRLASVSRGTGAGRSAPARSSWQRDRSNVQSSFRKMTAPE